MSTREGQSLRICHLGKYYPPAPGGIETHVQILARSQAALGHEVHVACVNHMNSSGRDLTWSRRGATPTVTEFDNDVNITRLGRSAHAAKLDVVPDITQFFRRLHNGSFDILHLHTPNPTMLLAVAAIRPWVPLVITHHSDVVKQRFLYPMFQPFEDLVYRRAHRIISSSPLYIGGSDRLRQCESKVRTIPMGLDLRPFLTPSEQALKFAASLREEHGPTLWLSVGRCVYYKGLHLALRALQSVPGKLLLVGQGPYRENLLRLARELGLEDRVIWFSYLDQHQLVGAYHAASAFWFPSNARSEAFGLVQIEAMASGCPVINSAIPHSGVPWVSENGATGLTVAVDNPEAIAHAALRLLESPELQRCLAFSGRARAIACFGDGAMAQQTVSLYRDVLMERENFAHDLTSGSAVRSLIASIPAPLRKHRFKLNVPNQAEGIEVGIAAG